MQQYLRLLNEIYNHGLMKHPVRVESGRVSQSTMGLANLFFDHDLRNGFPLLTTKKMNWTAAVGELRSFLSGCTNNRDFQQNGCNFWSPWARDDGDLGPIYGAQWNAHGQLQHVLNCLKNRLPDRRMVVSAWRPDEHQRMVLPPCHLMWVVTTYENQLSLSWLQRSCDFPIGVPYNIASYGLLAELLAAWGGFQATNLSAIFCDAHIYQNQLDGVVEQLARHPTELPKVKVSFDDPSNFHSWQVELVDYRPQSAISFGEVVV